MLSCLRIIRLLALTNGTAVDHPTKSEKGDPTPLNFDNIFHSLELVFVIMSANTFSDLMYYTIDSDYPPAALFFGAGIMIMMLWLTNLLIAVITSSFQVIREESKASAFTAEEAEPSPSRSDEVLTRRSLLQKAYDRTAMVWVIIIAFALIAHSCRSAVMSETRKVFIDRTELVATILLDVEICLRADEDGELYRISFSTIFNSFLGMYQILSSENWTDILYAVTAAGNGFDTAWIGAVFLIGWFILSFFILVNMFIAVIQENFDVSEDEKRLEQVKAFLQRKELGKSSGNLALSTIFTFGRNRKKKAKDPLDYGPAMMEMLLKDAVVREFLDDPVDPLQESAEPSQPLRQLTTMVGDVRPGYLSSLWGKVVLAVSSQEPNPFYSNIRFEGPNDNLDPRQMARQAVSATSARRRAQREYLARHPSYNVSLERFDGVEPNKIAWYSFSAFIYSVTVAMVILACVTTPLYQKQYREEHQFSVQNWYVWTDLAFAGVFTLEAAVKVIADGFWTPNAYYRSSWGTIDGVVLITLWIYVATLLANDGAVSRAVGAFKALRALRLLNLSDSARDTFHNVIIWGLWKIIAPAFVSISLLIPFAIYGLNLFSGTLVACNDDSDTVVRLEDCFGEYNSAPYSEDWLLLAPRVVSNEYLNFDDFGSSLFSLFQITYVQLHKFFLVGIVLLVIPRNDALDQLFKTAAASLTKISNLLATWLIFFIIFAIAMTQAFSLTRFGEAAGNGLNLRTVPNALILLFRMSCGEGWNEIMEDFAAIEPPLCVEGDDFFNSDCGSKPWARFFYVYQRSSGLAVVDRDEIRRFKEAWRSVDPAGTGFITKEAFPRLLGELSGVFEMRIYDADDSVRQILEDVRGDGANVRHQSLGASGGSSSTTGVDLDKLNERLSHIDVPTIRERRRRFNIFFEEVMVSADPDKGISFTTVLMILAHYNIISDSKSLRLEEFLRRRARLQRVEEEVRRRVVLGFFETLYWSRQFQRHMERKRAGRMAAVPQLDIPDILVDDEAISDGTMLRAVFQILSLNGSDTNNAHARL
ncbi:unnamed protein product [Parascedosporium putredinis]|uniref:Calcium-channel protein CCH1 n=1 Tax=Parascedosporium putredinis TaxID=1442378 RepID=A0A9P1H0I3_9PEZI|nr:unnamed protein product [Parascedosporium putredinis]CAI7992746.1 unnamed protein product [Parascedosporium putredinis]